MELIANINQPQNEHRVILTNYLITLMCICDQLRINHWQTECSAEHKLTDDIESTLREKLDYLGEVTMGNFDRIKFNRQNILLEDIEVTSTSTILAFICKSTKETLKALESTEYNDIINVLEDILSVITQGIYLSKLK